MTAASTDAMTAAPPTPQESARLLLKRCRDVPCYVRSGTDTVAINMSMLSRKRLRRGEAELRLETYDMLRELQQRTPGLSQADFFDVIFEKPTSDTAYVLAFLALDIRSSDRLRTLLSQDLDTAVRTIAAIHLRLQAESFAFTDVEVAALEGLLTPLRERFPPRTQQQLAGPLEQLLLLTEDVKYQRLKRSLKSTYNPEINADERRVFERAKSIGLSDALQTALHSINEKLLAASTKLDFKGCLDLARIALEELVEESCKRVERKAGRAVPTGPKLNNYQPYLDYLKNTTILVPHEADALQKFYNLLSHEGSHSLEAEAEQARVYRNIAVEWFLLITGRVQTFLRTP